jgi:peptide/nickel transport system substrate-binding protein
LLLGQQHMLLEQQLKRDLVHPSRRAFGAEVDRSGTMRFDPMFPRRSLLLGGAAVLGLWACGKSQPAAPNAAPSTGGELLFAFDGAAVTQFVLDPHNSLFAPHHRIMRSIFDNLVVALPGHRFGPWLAKSWTVSPDGLRYTFQLRDDVRFHDGTQFDADAVKFNFDRVADAKNALYSQIDVGPYKQTRVVDKFTAELELQKPFAALLANLSKTTLGIVSPSAVQKYGAQFPSHPVGSGPFKFDSLEAGTEVKLSRNPDYRWAPSGVKNQGPARLAKITFRNVPEESTRVAVLQSGQAGAVDLIPPQNLAQFKRSTDFKLFEGELLNHNYSLHLNNARAPWSSSNVREAFRLSLDIEGAVKSIYLGTAARAWSPLSPSFYSYDRTLENSWRPDPARAAQLLDAEGWKLGPGGIREKDGKKLSATLLDTQGNREKRLDLLLVFRRQLQKNGIEVQVDSQPLGTYMERVGQGNWDLLAGSQFASDPDVLRRIYSPSQRTRVSPSNANDPELNLILDQALSEFDEHKRAALYQRAQRLIVERNFAIPVYVLSYNVAAKNAVREIGIDVNGFPTFHEAWIGA